MICLSQTTTSQVEIRQRHVQWQRRIVGIGVRWKLGSMSSDIVFEPDVQRCIGVDVRYMLFIIEKFGKASHLIQELKIEG